MKRLVSYSGRDVVQCDGEEYFLTLRQNSTYLLSEKDLEAVTKAMGKQQFARFVKVHSLTEEDLELKRKSHEKKPVREDLKAVAEAMQEDKTKPETKAVKKITKKPAK
jgi:hypothetical protein